MSDSIEFSAEQAMLLDTAQDFCRERAPIALVREHIAEVETYDGIYIVQTADTWSVYWQERGKRESEVSFATHDEAFDHLVTQYYLPRPLRPSP